MKMGRSGKLALAMLLTTAIAGFFLFDLGRYLSLDWLKERQGALAALVDQRPVPIILLFFLVYVAVTALSLPGAAVLTLAAGAIFGLWLGTAIASLASTMGACLAFLSARTILGDWVRGRLGARAAAIDQGIARDGAFYLLTLRLVPVFPFFLVNLGMGLTAMRVGTYAWVSWIGMLPGTVVYVLAGTQLARVESTRDIVSPALLGSLILLGLFPLIARWAVGRWRRARVYRGFRRPRRFDRNLIVIGAGAGGLVTSLVAATVRAKVTLIEKGRMGGDCLNTGCVPSKTLIRTARLAHDMRNAAAFGLTPADAKPDLVWVMERVRSVIRAIEPADSVERYTSLGVDVRIGHAHILDPWTVEIDGAERLTSRAIVIAAGGEPVVPDIPGLREAGYLTTETLWDELGSREALPERLLILGGGPIGVELAQAFARLGSRVTLVERGERILPREDEEVSALVAQTLEEEGVDIRLQHQALRCEGKTLVASASAGGVGIPFDDIIVAVGRRARLSGYGLETLGIDVEKPLVANEYLETRFPNILAAGDVAGPYQFTHYAAHQAWFAAVNALFGSFRRFRPTYDSLPRVTYTDPEVAQVGHNRSSAAAAGLAFECPTYPLDHLDRALAEGAARGFVTVLIAPGTDRILGATIVAANAGEMIAEFALAMRHKLGLKKLLATVHAYPTMAEANRYAAGEWRKAHKPERLLALVERYHRWRRGA